MQKAIGHHLIDPMNPPVSLMHVSLKRMESNGRPARDRPAETTRRTLDSCKVRPGREYRFSTNNSDMNGQQLTLINQE